MEVHSAKVAYWGSGKDLVELVVGLDQYVSTTDQRIGDISIRGHGGLLFLHQEADGMRPAVTWTEAGCDYTVLLNASISVGAARSYAEAY